MSMIFSNSIQRRPVYVIGHLSRDLIGETGENFQMGGPPAYIGIQLARLAIPVTVITKLPESDPYLQELKMAGVSLINLAINDPEKRNYVTTFINKYDQSGKRTQMVKNVQEKITLADLRKANIDIPEKARIVMAPLMDEITPEVYRELGQEYEMIIAPQGHFRYIDKHSETTDGFYPVKRRSWENHKVISRENMVVLSRDDVDFSGGDQMLKKLREQSDFVILTKGQEGSTVFSGLDTLAVPAFHLEEHEEIDFTGTGDVFTAGIVAFNNIRRASLLAAIKIAKNYQEGALSVPHAEDFWRFLSEHHGYKEYLAELRALPDQRGSHRELYP